MAVFRRLHDAEPQAATTQFYLKHLDEMRFPLPENWSGMAGEARNGFLVHGLWFALSEHDEQRTTNREPPTNFCLSFKMRFNNLARSNLINEKRTWLP